MAATKREYPRAHFLSIPPEIREEIYRLLLNPDASRVWLQDEYSTYQFGWALDFLRVHSQVRVEAEKIFKDLNVFVRIETPWPEAQSHVAMEGHVPIIVQKERAKSFVNHSLLINIDAPEHSTLEWEPQYFVILLDDLDKFTRMWFYADLTHPGLNEHLRLKLTLRDPYARDWEEKRMPRQLQRRMMLPFGDVKNLHGTVIEVRTDTVKPFASIEQEMRKLQAEPHHSPEHCLREATRLKFEGNEALKKMDYAGALQKYNEAWKAMHVVIKGRKRHIHADAFFGQELTEEPYKGKNGQAERLMLRVHLVANTCLVFLKLEEWEQCRYWGMRSITMLREAMGADDRQGIPPRDEAVLGFPAADQMGKIYYRTAVAYKHLDDKGEARRLLRVAEIYLPRDQSIQQEISEVALRLG